MAQPWWLASLWQPFKWTPNNTSAHSGVDKGMPCGTPVQTPVSGTVINSGPQPWGGQVDVLTKPGELPPPYDQNSSYVLSYLHLSREDVKPGPITAGQQIGLSGQPPPGAGFGAGCHLHFEVTHGDTPPYTGYNPWRPTKSNYPQNGQPLIDFLAVNGPASATSTAWLSQPLSYSGASGTYLTSSTSGNNQPSIWQQIIAGGLGQVPVIGGSLQAAANSGNWSVLGAQFGWIFAWLTNPVRIAKLVVGVVLLFYAVILAFRPELAAALVTGVGQPELAPAAYKAAGGGQPRSLGFAKTPEQRAVRRQGQQTAALRENTAAIRESRQPAQEQPPQRTLRIPKARNPVTSPAANPREGAQAGLSGADPAAMAKQAAAISRGEQRRHMQGYTGGAPRIGLSQSRPARETEATPEKPGATGLRWFAEHGNQVDDVMRSIREPPKENK